MSTAAKVTLTPPPGGAKITIANGKLHVPDNPIIPFIEGDGTGPDIWRASVRVLDAAVEKAYGGKRKIHWLEVYAGEKANNQFGTWLPDRPSGLPRLPGLDQGPADHADRRRHPLAQRRAAPDARPLRLPAPGALVQGRAQPGEEPRRKVDMVIFRENCEDIYAGIEFEQGSRRERKFLALLKEHFPKEYGKIRFPETSGIGIKPVSKDGSERLIRAASSTRSPTSASR
jgi:isocitrate dehydrogenase